MGGLIKFEAKKFDLYNFLFNRLIIKKCCNAMDDDLNPKWRWGVQVLVLPTYDI
jgi:hypothetical protein